jgi:hypothetical protein
MCAFFAAQSAAKNRAIRSNSSQTASRFAVGFPLLSLAPHGLTAQLAPRNFQRKTKSSFFPPHG